MKKLTLEIDALQVEAFQVDPAMAGPRGTVQGYFSNELSCVNQCVPVPLTHGECGI